MKKKIGKIDLFNEIGNDVGEKLKTKSNNSYKK